MQLRLSTIAYNNFLATDIESVRHSSCLQNESCQFDSLRRLRSKNKCVWVEVCSRTSYFLQVWTKLCNCGTPAQGTACANWNTLTTVRRQPSVNAFIMLEAVSAIIQWQSSLPDISFFPSDCIAVTRVAFNPLNVKIFVSACLDQKVRLWNATNAAMVAHADCKELLTAGAFKSDGLVSSVDY